jgi:hypothetical protein
MKIAITFWGTGNYLDFLPKWYESIEDNFLTNIEKKYFIFTDGELIDSPDNIIKIDIPNYGFPNTFNKTFEEILKLKNTLFEYDWMVSIDADMIVNQKIEYDEFFDNTKKYIGVHHPCDYLKFPPHNEYPGSFETNSQSIACIDDTLDLSVYYQGCLWGGKIPEIFDMMKQIDLWIKDDLSRNIESKFYEESYLNKWFLTHKDDVHTLEPSFAFPELFEQYCDFDRKIIHLYKENKYFGNNQW